MKILFTIVISLLVIHSVCAQERTISGRLTSTDDGTPLPGINIAIKGTSSGTTTDADGNYSINVPIGSILVFSFIGMQSREVMVTEDNLQPVSSGKKNSIEKRAEKKRNILPIPKSLYQDSVPKNTLGLAVLTSESPSYSTRSKIDPTAIRAIKKLGNSYFIKSDTDPVRRTGFGLQFSSSLSFERINRLPSFQDTYAQGQPVGGSYQWIGADQQEIFSWGPNIQTLRFDASSYPFDSHGRLVAAGSGKGQQSKKYDALSFFKTGSSNVNEIMLALPGPKSSTLLFDVENRRRTGIIPNSEYRKTNIGTSLRNFRLSAHLNMNGSISYNQSNGNLLSRGANLASIVGSVFRTPATFDNSNARSPKAALNAKESYELAGTQRSHAPGIADNPYGLANELPDNEKTQRAMGFLNLHYTSPENHFSFVFNANLDKQWNENIFGIAPGYSGFKTGRLTDRQEQQTFVNAVITPAYRFNFSESDLKVSLSYQTQYTDRGLKRTDGFGFSADLFGRMGESDSLTMLTRELSRTTHEIIVGAQYEYETWLNVRLSNRNYFSSTVNYNQFNNIFPSGSLSVNLDELIYLWPIDHLKLYASGSRTLRESPLLYSNWSYQSTNVPLESYTSFYESNELFFTENLAPENETKFEAGLKLRSLNSQLTLEASYFNNLTENFIAPRNSALGFSLSNLATIKNHGATISAGYFAYMNNATWGTDLRWSKYNTLVQELHSSEEWIPVAGFESVQSVLAAGQPLGAIYGTTFIKNSEGKKIIGPDGFPVEDVNLKMIGNPIPDWMLGWSGYVRWKRFNFSFLFDYKHGGDIWNGTRSALDYLGRSATSGSERNLVNYIFDGVDVDGDPNAAQVIFSDPARPLAENRWVRYGWDGVGEDYIEDGSWLRLSELVLSYAILNASQSKVKEIRFSLIGRNLFLITPYTGVDPAATLFGYSTANGLDFFNTPSTRSYGAQITIKI